MLTKQTRSNVSRRQAVGLSGAAIIVSGGLAAQALVAHDWWTGLVFGCALGVAVIALLLATRSPQRPVPRLLEAFEDDADID